jgi:HD superfamily phosphodiesterase
MDLGESILFAEKKYLQTLEEFFTRIWGETRLFSHDIDHHRRVWRNARELLEVINSHGVTFAPEFPGKLMIACYMHDLGMSADSGIRHGIHSREMCRQFLQENFPGEPDCEDLLDAVEIHDNKEYTADDSSGNEILKLLSAADDLDAFGYIGIYRYIEIYLARGIRPEIIGSEIKKNALGRFRNFKRNFGDYPELISKYRKKYLILDNFFTRYNKEVS